MSGLREYTVGTFRHERSSGKPFFLAYLRTYNPAWEGCIQYRVRATNGPDAKRKAIAMRKNHEEYLSAKRAEEAR